MTDISTSWLEVISRVKWQLEIQVKGVMFWSVLWLVVGGWIGSICTNHITLPTTNQNTHQSITTYCIFVWIFNHHVTLMMTSTKDVKMSITTQSPSQDSFHPNNQISLTYVTPGFKPCSWTSVSTKPWWKTSENLWVSSRIFGDPQRPAKDLWRTSVATGWCKDPQRNSQDLVSWGSFRIFNYSLRIFQGS